mmetsp:Transcript_8483/g.18492  ORF Transcript_8483/g.18492 Transcript_8483/m.18492 type:complete len:297 (-) Transcript_8483:612-1502(-)
MALHARTACPSDAMDVVLGIARRVVVDNEGDAFNIKATSRNICGHKQLDPALLQAIQSLLASPLVLVSVHGAARNTVAIQLLRKLIAHPLCPAEDEALGRVVVSVCHAGLAQDLQDRSILLMAAARLNSLCDILIALELIAVADGDGVWPAEKFGSEAPNRRRPRGCEEERVPLPWALRQHLPDLRLEAHVKHSIRLVENELADLVQVELVALQEVIQSAWGADDPVHAVADLRSLRALWGSPIAADRLDAAALPELVGLLLDLHGQLARRRHDHERRVSSTDLSLHHVGKCGQQK